jgi:MscS family membrane protein
MQRKLMTVYRGVLVILVLVTFGAIWASAQQPPANGSIFPKAVASTNATVVVSQSQGVLAAKLGGFEQKLEERDIIFHLDKIKVLREYEVFDQPLWKYVASLIFIFLAFYVSKLFDFIIGVWLKRWASKTETKFDDLLLEAVHGPIKVVSFVIFLNIGLAVFQWPEKVQSFLSKALIVTVAFSITYVTLKIVDLLMSLWRERTAADADKTFNDQLFPLIRKSLKAFVVIVSVLVTAQNLKIDITGILASLSIGGLALGLAAQDTLANFFGAIALYADKPFHIGDRIKLDSVDGMVENIGMRSTRVRSMDGHHVTVPNKTMANAVITNITRRPNIKSEMNIGLTYDMPMDKVKRALVILDEVYRAHPNTTDLIISFNKFSDSWLNILIVHWWKGTELRDHLAGMQELNLKIKERFDAEGIGFAFPSQTLYLKQDSEWKTKTTAA